MANITVSSEQVKALVNKAIVNKDNALTETGIVTALSYRTLRVSESDRRLDIATGNSEFSIDGAVITHKLKTIDGYTVFWYRSSLGIVSGSDFLPESWYDLPWRLVFYDVM